MEVHPPLAGYSCLQTDKPTTWKMHRLLCWDNEWSRIDHLGPYQYVRIDLAWLVLVSARKRGHRWEGVLYAVDKWTRHLVDGVANSQQVKSFEFLLATFFLHERNDECSSVVVIFLVWIHYLDAVLRIRPERLWITARHNQWTTVSRCKIGLQGWSRRPVLPLLL